MLLFSQSLIILSSPSTTLVKFDFLFPSLFFFSYLSRGWEENLSNRGKLDRVYRKRRVWTRIKFPSLLPGGHCSCKRYDLTRWSYAPEDRGRDPSELFRIAWRSRESNRTTRGEKQSLRMNCWKALGGRPRGPGGSREVRVRLTNASRRAFLTEVVEGTAANRAHARWQPADPTIRRAKDDLLPADTPRRLLDSRESLAESEPRNGSKQKRWKKEKKILKYFVNSKKLAHIFGWHLNCQKKPIN